jgi:hypothetical protein
VTRKNEAARREGQAGLRSEEPPGESQAFFRSRKFLHEIQGSRGSTVRSTRNRNRMHGETS